jgi:hypothetical protein
MAQIIQFVDTKTDKLYDSMAELILPSNNININHVKIFSGFFTDDTKKPITVGDRVQAKLHIPNGKFSKLEGAVTFDFGCFCIKVETDDTACGYDIGQEIPMFDMISIRHKAAPKINNTTKTK